MSRMNSQREWVAPPAPRVWVARDGNGDIGLYYWERPAARSDTWFPATGDYLNAGDLWDDLSNDLFPSLRAGECWEIELKRVSND